ncbi:amidase [Streptomyces europaeiscabiei]|nr:amidase [Streptomyces europaeiscabiei]MDX3715054.1 amidase [Streptomyces europaeiscabiei]MDX3860978.1 amidase [Streptomyces europaeiscabiei]MDX3873524.1 amidase [Streptomyces europaeiscabiei]
MPPLSAEQIAAAVQAGETTAVDVVAAALARIEQAEPTLHAFVEVWAEEALRRAAEVDAQVAAGVHLPLAGVPIGVKGRAGLRAAAARALVAAGCVPVGATSVPGPGTPWQTWGLGAGGRTVNPWRADRTPGGSSAGSAAAVAAGLVPMATGTDGAGSVRIPAAWCGVVGLKTTNGRLPSPDRTGLAAAGVLTRYASDAAAYWRCVTQAGDAQGSGDRGSGGTKHDGPEQPYAAERPYAAGTTGTTGTTRAVAAAEVTQAADGSPPVAVWSADLGFADTDPEPAAIAHGAVLRLADAGLVRLTGLTGLIGLVRPPVRQAHPPVHQGTPPSRAANPPEPQPGPPKQHPHPHPLRLEDPAPAWLALRAAPTPDAHPAPLQAAQELRAENDRRLAALFAEVDLVLTPTTPNAPHGHDGPGDRYSTALTWAFNLSGHPATSIPAGFDSDGCPVGLQLVARHGDEALLLRVAEAAEAVLEYPDPETETPA